MSYAIPFDKNYLIYDNMGTYIRTSKYKPFCIETLSYDKRTGLFYRNEHHTKKKSMIYFLLLLCIMMIPFAPLIFLILNLKKNRFAPVCAIPK